LKGGFDDKILALADLDRHLLAFGITRLNPLSHSLAASLAFSADWDYSQCRVRVIEGNYHFPGTNSLWAKKITSGS
jgi:hypothetical protein